MPPGRADDLVVSVIASRQEAALAQPAELGELEIARCLLAHGASASVQARGLTPLALAELRKAAELIALLTSHVPS